MSMFRFMTGSKKSLLKSQHTNFQARTWFNIQGPQGKVINLEWNATKNLHQLITSRFIREYILQCNRCDINRSFPLSYLLVFPFKSITFILANFGINIFPLDIEALKGNEMKVRAWHTELYQHFGFTTFYIFLAQSIAARLIE